MVNEEIFSGLKSALERGESLKRAMTTFFNSGYKKEEIEEAAKALSEQPVEAKIQTPPVIISEPVPQIPLIKTPKKSFFKILFPEKKPKEQVPQTIQKVSKYEENPREKILIIILVASLIFLIVALLLIFLFRQQLINLFSGMFSSS